MRLSQAGIEFIQHFEAFRPFPYVCPAGYLTCGFGHVVRPGEDFSAGITEDVATDVLMRDAALAERSVMRLICVPLTQGQYDALTSFVFNLGGGALQRSRLRAVVNRGEHEQAPSEFARWVFAGGRKLAGLIRRRHAEAHLYALGI